MFGLRRHPSRPLALPQPVATLLSLCCCTRAPAWVGGIWSRPCSPLCCRPPSGSPGCAAGDPQQGAPLLALLWSRRWIRGRRARRCPQPGRVCCGGWGPRASFPGPPLHSASCGAFPLPFDPHPPRCPVCSQGPACPFIILSQLPHWHPHKADPQGLPGWQSMPTPWRQPGSRAQHV